MCLISRSRSGEDSISSDRSRNASWAVGNSCADHTKSGTSQMNASPKAAILNSPVLMFCLAPITATSKAALRPVRSRPNIASSTSRCSGSAEKPTMSARSATSGPRELAKSGEVKNAGSTSVALGVTALPQLIQPTGSRRDLQSISHHGPELFADRRHTQAHRLWMCHPARELDRLLPQCGLSHTSSLELPPSSDQQRRLRVFIDRRGQRDHLVGRSAVPMATGAASRAAELRARRPSLEVVAADLAGDEHRRLPSRNVAPRH